jgi:hypothetical protein
MDLRNSPSSIVGNSYHWHSVQAVNLSSKPQSSEFCNSWLLAPGSWLLAPGSWLLISTFPPHITGQSDCSLEKSSGHHHR